MKPLLEALLQRVAQRGEGSFRLRDWLHSIPGVDFPARQPSADPNAPTAQAGLSIWEQSCARREGAAASAAAAQAPGALLDERELPLLVAESLWENRRLMGGRVCHLIEQRWKQVVAEVSPQRREVLIRKQVKAEAHSVLHLHVLPASARPMDGEVAAQFEPHTVPALMWAVGQHRPASSRWVPAELWRAPVALRKLPAIEPRLLGVRHLALLHRFSAGPMLLAQLAAGLSEAQCDALCADLTSLYLTASLGPSA